MSQVSTAMILAAGRGARMRPFTDLVPKPLAPVADKPLIVHTIERLVSAGVEQIVINISWRGQQIREMLGDGSAFATRIAYSDEGEHALETGGGIVKALPLLGDQPFWVVSGDIWIDYPYAARASQLMPTDLVHLVLVPNPDFHPLGDFYLRAGRVNNTAVDAQSQRLTYASLGLFRPELFAKRAAGIAPMQPWLREAMTAARVSGERFDGEWCNVGTVDQLQELDHTLRKRGKT
ncbi:MAG: nucleotidyltransferase family protein [Candidatus Obscuribacterales bacterium]|nr:nucleotidyltransferase family protein [Steroidobacteraceae bacterium]